MNANERIKEIENEIEKLEDKIWDLKCERDELYKENAQYFIVNIFRGDGNYWDEYLWPIGFVTEAEARELADKNNPEQDIDECWMGSTPAYFAVSKEVFDLYVRWRDLRRAGMQIRKVDDPVYEMINKEIRKICVEQLGIKNSYTHIETGRP